MREQISFIKKRSGKWVDFDERKITTAIEKAGKDTGEFGHEEATGLKDEVLAVLKEEVDITVEKVQDTVELVLITSEYSATAKAYIIYREMRRRERRPDIFSPRMNLKPAEYPQLLGYVDAIRHSYWVHTEFNFTSDVQDFTVGVSIEERNAIKNAMLAISQVEVAVKTFWGNLFHRMPKPEVGSVGYTFADSEVRHYDAYSALLELLGLDDEFERIAEIPELMQRVQYLSDSVKLSQTGSDKDYTLSILLFSLFIEHVSLFSQFLVMMSFNKYRNQFKGISNVIEATSKEEQIHGLFGTELINIIRSERPEWFDSELESRVYEACKEAYRSEEIVIDWIYEAGDLDFMPKHLVKEFVKNRLNNSLVNIGYEPVFEVDMELVEQTDWFDDEIIGTTHGDFFYKRNTAYSSRDKSITADDLF